jgi:hypothetical protein
MSKFTNTLKLLESKIGEFEKMVTVKEISTVSAPV